MKSPLRSALVGFVAVEVICAVATAIAIRYFGLPERTDLT